MQRPNLSSRNGTNCKVCDVRIQIMKRCTRCKQVFYCSRECQIKDWPDHKQNCGKRDDLQAHTSTSNIHQHSVIDRRYRADDGSIFGTDDPSASSRDNELQDKGSSESDSHNKNTVIDFQAAANDLKKKKHSISDKTESVKYLCEDSYHTDVPVLDKSEPCTEIVIKANREKQTVLIQDSWSGSDIYKLLSSHLKISLDKMKVIHKGKVMTQETIQSAVSKKAMFQVIGEQAANEDGLDARDIELMMKQLNIGRNEAVLALRKSGDIIDAMLQLGGK